MGKLLLSAFALMLVLEGLLPFAAPAAWRNTMLKVAGLAEGQIRFIGLSSMPAGVILLTIFR